MIASAVLLVTMAVTTPNMREGVAPEIDDFGAGHAITDRPATDADPLWLIRTTNRLIPLGKARAMAAIQAFEKRNPNPALGYDLYWLCNLIFEPTTARGYIDVPRIGAIMPEPPHDLRLSPHFPLLLQNDIPFCILSGVMIGGFPEPVSSYLTRVSGTATFRLRMFVPSNDPFEALLELRRSSAWPKVSSATTNMPSADMMLREILLLVRTAYVPRRPVPRFINWDGGIFEKLHTEYLALHPRWDSRLQIYVRGDGSYDPIK